MKNIKFLSILGLASLAMFVSCTEDDGVERPWEPDITDLSVGTVSYDSAVLSARFSDDLTTAPAEVGVMYSTDYEVDAEPTNVLGTVNADNKQVYEMQLSELEANSTYYYYIYSLKSEASTDTIKSAISSFETLALQTAKVESPKLVEATDTSMEMTFTIHDNGGADITAYGVAVFVAGEKENPIEVVPGEVEITSFPYTASITIEGLHYSTEYDFITYANTSVGVVYGPRLSYKTLDPRVYSPTYDLIGRNLSLAANIREDITGATESGFLLSTVQGLPQDDAEAIHVAATLDGQSFASTEDTKIEVMTDYWACAYIMKDGETIYGDTTRVEKIEVKPFVILKATMENDYRIMINLQGKVDPATFEQAKNNFVLDVTNTYNGANYVGTATIASIELDEEDRSIIYFNTNEQIYNTDVVTLSHVEDDADLQNDLEMVFDHALFTPIVVKSHLVEPFSNNDAFVMDGAVTGWDTNPVSTGRIEEIEDPHAPGEYCFKFHFNPAISKMMGNLSSPFKLPAGTYTLTWKMMQEPGGTYKWFSMFFGNALGTSFAGNFTTWGYGGGAYGKAVAGNWLEMSRTVTIAADAPSAYFYMNGNATSSPVYMRDLYMSNAVARP